MKKLCIIAILILSSGMISAQAFEIKTSPILLPFNIWQVNAEFFLKEDFSIEPGVIAVPEADGGAILSCLGKYYFSPSPKGNDLFHIGMFLNYIIADINGPGLGFYAGYKWLSKKNITFEIGGGIGRIIGHSEQSITGIGQLAVGYRFGAHKAKEK